MDTVTYMQMMQDVLQDYLDFIQPHSATMDTIRPAEVETLPFFDPQNHICGLLDVGWQGTERREQIIVLMRLVKGKIWVEVDQTDYGFVEALLEAGILQEDIVLAFHHPRLRQYTDFAVA